MTAAQTTTAPPTRPTADRGGGRCDGYTVLARRYRSRDFDELIGQEPIARTLQNAIASGRTAHAYLFCGTRGVGKTSMARIFAKALNATSDLAEVEAIGNAILRGEDLDVIEIDGASNRGIQEARDLIAGAGLSPARCRYKIYIIDEVHMLTREAFNALLKTMEEPPSHVKFILCTTDPHKVPATIQSRCQRFDFRTIPTPLIAGQIRRVLEQEGIEADDSIVVQVARLGGGSMRDALSLLDRLIAMGDGRLTAEQAHQMLGLPDQALLARIIDAVSASDPKATLEAGAELLSWGATVEQALEMLAEYLRTLMVIAACGSDSDLLELSSDAVEEAARQAGCFEVSELVHLIALCDATARNARGSAAARALFDAAIVRMCLRGRFADIGSLLQEQRPTSTAEGKKKDDGPAPVESVSARRSYEPALDRAADLIARTPEHRSARPPAKAEAGTAAGAMVEVKQAFCAPAPTPEATEPLDAQMWERVLESAKASPGVHARFSQLRFRSFDGRTLKLTIDPQGARSARFLGAQTDSVAEFVQKATGRQVRVEIDVPATESRPVHGAQTREMEEVRKMPLVQKAMQLFDAVATSVHDAAPPPEA